MLPPPARSRVAASPTSLDSRCPRLAQHRPKWFQAARNSSRWCFAAETGHRLHGDGQTPPPERPGQPPGKATGFVNDPGPQIRPAKLWSWRPLPTQGGLGPKPLRLRPMEGVAIEAIPHQGNKSNWGRLPGCGCRCRRPTLGFALARFPAPIRAPQEGFRGSPSRIAFGRFRCFRSNESCLVPQRAVRSPGFAASGSRQFSALS